MSIIRSNQDNRTVFAMNGETVLEAEFSYIDTIPCIAFRGAVKTMVAPCLNEIITEFLSHGKDFIIDLADVSYIASAGLRVLLNMQQEIDENETFSVKLVNISSSVKDVLESTGFINILNIE